MPLDPSIPLSAVGRQQPLDIVTPVVQGLQLRHLLQRQQAGELELEDATRERAEARQLRDIFATNSDAADTPQYLRDIGRISRTTYRAEQQAVQNLRKAKQDYAQGELALQDAELKHQQFEVEQEQALAGMALQKITACLAITDSEKRQACYARSRAEAKSFVQSLAVPEERKAQALADIDGMPEQIDVQGLTQERLQGLDFQAQLDEKRKELAEMRKGIAYKKQEAEAMIPVKVAEAAQKSAATLEDRIAVARERPRYLQTQEGFIEYDPATGSAQPLTGSSGERLRPRMTSEQSKAYSFGSRAFRANTLLANFEKRGVSSANPTSLVSRIPFLGNYFLPEDLQQYEQAKLDFLTAALRKESGAVIGASEIITGNKQYFPVPGDTVATIEQKRQNRVEVIRGIEVEAGRSLAPSNDDILLRYQRP